MRLFVDNLTNLDFSYLHPERGIVGETWLANIELVGELDEQGMVCDFGIIKKMLRSWLDSEIDHRLVVPTRSDQLSITNTPGNMDLRWQYGGNHQDKYLQTRSPEQAICMVNAIEISPQSVSQWCIEQLKPLFPASVIELKLNFQIEAISGPYYHYSHGLKKHDGNCQRIAHGHRSKIEIWKNNELDLELMAFWAKQWQDIYIGSQSDLVPIDSSSIAKEHVAFAYEAQQGMFYFSIPKEDCYLIDTDSTVELIAQHIANTLTEKDKVNSEKHDYIVKAYEGISKGAIVETSVTH